MSIHPWHVQVNHEFRRPMPAILCDDTKEAIAAMRQGRFIRIWSLHGRLPNDGLYEGTAIRLTRYRTGLKSVTVCQAGGRTLIE